MFLTYKQFVRRYMSLESLVVDIVVNGIVHTTLLYEIYKPLHLSPPPPPY